MPLVGFQVFPSASQIHILGLQPLTCHLARLCLPTTKQWLKVSKSSVKRVKNCADNGEKSKLKRYKLQQLVRFVSNSY